MPEEFITSNKSLVLNGSAIEPTHTTINGTDIDRGDTDRAMIADDVYQYVNEAFYTYVIPTICLCGLIGNGMAVKVLYRTARHFRQSIYIYMCALTVIDTLYMIISLIRCAIAIVKTFNETIYYLIYGYSFAALMFLDMSMSDASVFILIIMTIERFFAIRNPLRVKEIVIAKRPFLFIVGSCAFVICMIIPLPFCLDLKEIETNANTTEYQVVPKTDMIQFLNYYTAAHSIILNYLPFLIIVSLNIALPIQYAKSIKNSSLGSFSNAADSQLRLLATVCVVTLTYALLALPQIFIETLSVIDNRYNIRGSERNIFWLMEDVNNVLTNINMAVDFIIYILMSKVYRKRFLTMFCLRKNQSAGDRALYVVAESQF